MDWTTGIITWLASVTGVSALGWLLRNWISTRLTHGIKHEYDKKIETIKSELSRHRDQLSAVQNNALGIAKHQSQLLETRRIDSIEKIWKSIVALAGQKTATKMMQSVNFDFAVNKAPSDPKIREMFSTLNKTFKIGPEGMAADSTDVCRLYVSAETWATFSAYKQVIFFAVTKMKMLEIGYDGTQLWKIDEIVAMVKAVLPHQSKFIDKYGMSSLDFLVEEIEAKLFGLLWHELHGSAAGKENAERAEEIMKHAQRTHIDGAAQQVGALDALTGAGDLYRCRTSR